VEIAGADMDLLHLRHRRPSFNLVSEEI